jgi:serine/threonine protein kinase/tetratricopeptide (TPR) repeat protein
MSPRRSSGRGTLLESIRNGTSSVRLALSQLKTRRKEPPVKAAPVRLAPSADAPRWGHLVLLEKVGAGAFGEVYRAWDTKLEREVALKLLEAHGCEDPSLLEEARMLARLRHPNVVTVHGVDHQDGRFGVWMDFIEGKSLEQVLEEHGPMSAREAALIGLDVSRALAAVHRSGLVHRDIKAQNVMREEGGRIVLMDFGLGHDATAGPNEDLGGTPVYMAPELFEGQPASLRSDIYALGVLLYHLVTGSFPVEGASVKEISTAHSEGAVVLMTDARPDLPSTFARVIEKATAADPARRYTTAGQMNAALDATLVEEGHALRPLKRRVLLSTAAVVLAAALGLGGWWLTRPSMVVPSGAPLLFTEIANTTGDHELDSVTELVRTQLTQSRHFNLLDAEQVKDTLKRMTRSPDQRLDPPVAREVALRSGAPLLVYGTLSPLGSGYALSLKLERIQGKPSPPAAAFTQLFEAQGGKNSLFDAIHQASIWVRREGGEATKEISETDRRPEEATTSSWEALDYYARGQRLNEEHRSTEDAIAMYTQAVRVDPDFGLALMRLGNLLSTMNRMPEAYAVWHRTVEAVDKRPPSRREELRIRGFYANMTEDYVNAEALERTLALLYPQESLAYHMRALALRNLGRLEEAREQLQRAESLRHDIANLTNLALVEMMLGDYTKAVEYLKGARATQPAIAGYLDGVKDFLVGDYSAAETSFLTLTRGPDTRLRSLGYGDLVCLLAEKGQEQAALATVREGIVADSRVGNPTGQARKLLAFASLSLEKGDLRTMHTAALQAAGVEKTSRTFLRAGTMLARGGFVADARRLLARMDFPGEGRRQEVNIAILAGEIALAERNNDQAISELRRAATLAPPIQPREYLARALQQVGENEEALAVYQSIITAPGSIWQSADDFDPGIWSRCMLRAAELQARVGQSWDARQTAARFLKIRERADSDSAELATALKLLAHL